MHLQTAKFDFAIEPLAQILDRLFPDVRLDTLRQDGGGDKEPYGCHGDDRRAHNSATFFSGTQTSR